MKSMRKFTPIGLAVVLGILAVFIVHNYVTTSIENGGKVFAPVAPEIAAEEPVEEPTFADAIPKGNCAVTINIDDRSSIGGNLSPEDRVDILITDINNHVGSYITVTLLQNIRVLDVQADTATLCVDMYQAQKLLAVELSSKVTMSLRSPDDDIIYPTPDATTIMSLYGIVAEREDQEVEVQIEYVYIYSPKNEAGPIIEELEPKVIELILGGEFEYITVYE
jgi:Flp pilus assembly protein CpaB